jgi:hypothetical protein
MKLSRELSQFARRVIDFLEQRPIKLKVRANNVITVRRDDGCAMAEVLVNGKVIMTGNTWDFHPGCHGFDLPNFSTCEELARLFVNGLERAGLKAIIQTDVAWRYE